MTNSRPTSSVFLVLFALMAGFAIGNYCLMQNTLSFENQLTARRIESCLKEVLEHAHHLQDDLVIQSAIKGLAEGPGIVFGTLVNPDGNIMADGQPAELGQAFRMPRFSGDRVAVWSSVLKTGVHPWGTCYFGLSKATLRNSLERQLFLSLFWILGFSVWFLWVWSGWDKALKASQTQLEEMALLVKEQTYDIEMLKKSHHEDETLRLSQIQSAADQFPEAALLLDHHQRLIAFNKRAQLLLERTEGPKGWIGYSWQDIPLLKHFGEALQQSMESPPDNLGTTTWVYPVSTTDAC
jgi:hypothetical protein